MDKLKLTNEEIGTELASIRRELDIQKEIATLRAEVMLQLSYFKWIGWSVAACAAILGFFGFKAWNDLTTSAQAHYEKQLNEMQDRYSNLSRGFSLVDSGRTRESIPYLIPLYESNRYDEPVLRSLFYALIDINDCDEGLRRLKEVRQDEQRFKRLRDSQIYNQAGNILRDCSVDESDLEEARSMFELSLKRTNADDIERRFPLYSLFTYYFIKHDLKASERYLREAANIQADYLGAEPPLEEPWVKKLILKNDPIVQELKPLWARVAKNKKTNSPP